MADRDRFGGSDKDYAYTDYSGRRGLDVRNPGDYAIQRAHSYPSNRQPLLNQPPMEGPPQRPHVNPRMRHINPRGMGGGLRGTQYLDYLSGQNKINLLEGELDTVRRGIDEVRMHPIFPSPGPWNEFAPTPWNELTEEEAMAPVGTSPHELQHSNPRMRGMDELKAEYDTMGGYDPFSNELDFSKGEPVYPDPFDIRRLGLGEGPLTYGKDPFNPPGRVKTEPFDPFNPPGRAKTEPYDPFNNQLGGGLDSLESKIDLQDIFRRYPGLDMWQLIQNLDKRGIEYANRGGLMSLRR